MLLTGCLYFCIFVCWWVYCGFATVRWLRRITAVKLTCSSVNINARLLHPSESPASRSQMNARWPLVVCFFSGVLMLLHPAWWTCAVDSKTVGLVVTTLFSESNVVWCVVFCAESQCWFALKGTWSVYIYTFDPKTVDLYKYIPLIPRLWIWTSSISKLVAVASAVVGIGQCSYAFDPETVDLYKYLWSQDCGSI